MNLRVDLILETEQRSASPVSLNFIIRVVAITLLSVLVLVRLRQYENNLEMIKGKHDAYLSLKANMVIKRAVLAECQGWENSRIEWCKVMDAFQRLVPATIQLRDVKVERLNSTVNKKPVRLFTINIKGKATTDNAANDVEKLRQDLLKAPEFAGRLKEVVIPQGSFKVDPAPAAAKTDRVFELVCRYNPVAYE